MAAEEMGAGSRHQGRRGWKQSTGRAEPYVKREVEPLQYEWPKCQGHSTSSEGGVHSFGFLEVALGEAETHSLPRL